MSASNQNSLFVEINRYELDGGFYGRENISEIGSYSLDIDRTFENSKKSLRYFVKPPNPENVRFDLKKGFETRIVKERGEDTSVLNWIKANMYKLAVSQENSETRENKESEETAHNRDSSTKDFEDVQTELSELKLKEDVARSSNLAGEPKNLHTDFVCRRGILTKLMFTPFESKEGWEFAVTLYNGTNYIIEIVSEAKKEHEKQMKDNKTCCGGWKFEQYLTADCKDGVPNTDVPYNNCEAFYTVVKSQLNTHTLVYSGEVDAVDNEGNYIEFKTLEELKEGFKMSFKRHKVKTMWAQSHLVGVKKILCGFRDENGIVKRLEYFNTEELPKIQSQWRDPHNSNMCLNFLDRFLSFIKSSINTDDHKIVHIIKWSPPGKDQPHRIECSPPLTNSEYNFLPQWYIDATT